MPWIGRTSSSTTRCFFCHTASSASAYASTSSAPSTPRVWRCEECGQINASDWEVGEKARSMDAAGAALQYEASKSVRYASPIASGHASLGLGRPSSMPHNGHELATQRSNSRSSGSRRWPSNELGRDTSTQINKGPFCHRCATNQTIVTSLLSSYYPQSGSVSVLEEAQLESEYPSYVASLEERYPTLCEVCRPRVEETIRERDRMARAQAYQGWLGSARAERNGGATAERWQDHSHVRTNQAHLPRPLHNPTTPDLQHGTRLGVLVWAIRGALWAASTAAGLTLSLCAALPPHLDPMPSPIEHRVARLLLLSLPLAPFWTFWDPFYLRLLSTRRRLGANVKVRYHGRPQWLHTQALLLVLRSLGALLCLQLRANSEEIRDPALKASHDVSWWHSGSTAASCSLVLAWIFNKASRTVTSAFMCLAQAFLLSRACLALSISRPASLRLVSTSTPAAGARRSEPSLRSRTPSPETTFADLNLDPLAASASKLGTRNGGVDGKSSRQRHVFGRPSMTGVLRNSPQERSDDCKKSLQRQRQPGFDTNLDLHADSMDWMPSTSDPSQTALPKASPFRAQLAHTSSPNAPILGRQTFFGPDPCLPSDLLDGFGKSLHLSGTDPATGSAGDGNGSRRKSSASSRQERRMKEQNSTRVVLFAALLLLVAVGLAGVQNSRNTSHLEHLDRQNLALVRLVHGAWNALKQPVLHATSKARDLFRLPPKIETRLELAIRTQTPAPPSVEDLRALGEVSHEPTAQNAQLAFEDAEQPDDGWSSWSAPAEDALLADQPPVSLGDQSIKNGQQRDAESPLTSAKTYPAESRHQTYRARFTPRESWW
ncbi:hypothetical protein IE81DRAFT_320131 [Ceraceosorus guamensis]|uniref:Ima1 N-terminal domain-containing protein n=1 Tax=Ceraceosorus guamensis TaxID=1522189 RepID=A0A316W6I7_9BASI|nr:hypothetical protein IE81DRAFT_320131 [Ceraceosorus guamensis]PWN45382.1 hypothetical protein IE81DRAFT_320131 [Ceraceosorus guamensis]